MTVKRSEVRGQKSEVRSQKSEVRSQKSEVRSQKSEVTSQRSEVRGHKSEVSFEQVADEQTPPASAAWYFNFSLAVVPIQPEDTTGFSRVEFQFRPAIIRLKLKYHAAKAGGVIGFFAGFLG